VKIIYQFKINHCQTSPEKKKRNYNHKCQNVAKKNQQDLKNTRAQNDMRHNSQASTSL